MTVEEHPLGLIGTYEGTESELPSVLALSHFDSVPKGGMYDGCVGVIAYYLGVQPDRRGSGIARGLLDAGCDWLRARGCPKVELMVRDGHPAAGLYERLDWDLQPVRVFARRLD